MVDKHDENLLLGYVEETLTDTELARVRLLMRSDPRLEEMLDGMKADKARIKALPEPAAPQWLMDDVDQQLERAMLMEEGAARNEAIQHRQRQRMRRLIFNSSLAAMLLIVASVVVRSLINPPAGPPNNNTVATTHFGTQPDGKSTEGVEKYGIVGDLNRGSAKGVADGASKDAGGPDVPGVRGGSEKRLAETLAAGRSTDAKFFGNGVLDDRAAGANAGNDFIGGQKGWEKNWVAQNEYPERNRFDALDKITNRENEAVRGLSNFSRNLAERNLAENKQLAFTTANFYYMAATADGEVAGARAQTALYEQLNEIKKDGYADRGVQRLAEQDFEGKTLEIVITSKDLRKTQEQLARWFDYDVQYTAPAAADKELALKAKATGAATGAMLGRFVEEADDFGAVADLFLGGENNAPENGARGGVAAASTGGARKGVDFADGAPAAKGAGSVAVLGDLVGKPGAGEGGGAGASKLGLGVENVEKQVVTAGKAPMMETRDSKMAEKPALKATDPGVAPGTASVEPAKPAPAKQEMLKPEAARSEAVKPEISKKVSDQPVPAAPAASAPLAAEDKVNNEKAPTSPVDSTASAAKVEAGRAPGVQVRSKAAEPPPGAKSPAAAGQGISPNVAEEGRKSAETRWNMTIKPENQTVESLYGQIQNRKDLLSLPEQALGQNQIQFAEGLDAGALDNRLNRRSLQVVKLADVVRTLNRSGDHQAAQVRLAAPEAGAVKLAVIRDNNVAAPMLPPELENKDRNLGWRWPGPSISYKGVMQEQIDGLQAGGARQRLAAENRAAAERLIRLRIVVLPDPAVNAAEAAKQAAPAGAGQAETKPAAVPATEQKPAEPATEGKPGEKPPAAPNGGVQPKN